MTPSPTLVGDGVENAWNALKLQHAAEMFGWNCVFRDRYDLQQDWNEKCQAASPVFVPLAEICRRYRPLVAFDNGKGAQPLYGFRPRHPDHLALVVGNERHGIASDLLHESDHLVEVPMVSRRVNSLNVAAAAAVALFYLSKGGGGALYTRRDPNRSRPELFLVGAGDHVELGSTIRSAAAFGWHRAFVEDRAEVWFGGDRRLRLEARGAARRAKNAIRLVKAVPRGSYSFEEACVVSVRPGGQPLTKTNLARGPRQVVVLVDDGHLDVGKEDWGRLARNVRFVTIDLPPGAHLMPHPYRLTSTIALAEMARQVGIRRSKAPRAARPPIYDRVLATQAEESAEIVYLEDLRDY
ncbi:MAG: hypothetical protein MPN21_27165 [Thermoanaerobaculia bacterium]|nr:hypothetical protein [Thermoanaerobaculia bacterium]